MCVASLLSENIANRINSARKTLELVYEDLAAAKEAMNGTKNNCSMHQDSLAEMTQQLAMITFEFRSIARRYR